jgi:hypothetical protein
MAGAASSGSDGKLTLFAATSKSVYRVGEPVPYMLLLRNASDTSLVVNVRLLPNYDETFPHEILLNVIGPGGERKELIPIIRAADPVASDFSELEADSFFMKELYLNELFSLITPGTYSIEAVYENYTVPPGLDPWTGTLHSNPVTITITE